MSKLLQQIKEDQLEARKSGNKAKSKALTTLIGEASPSGKEIRTDLEVEEIVVKFIKNINETLKVAGPNEALSQEIVTLQKYLPPMFGKDDIRALISNIDRKNIGMVMGLCKRTAKEQDKLFNGALVQEVIKELSK